MISLVGSTSNHDHNQKTQKSGFGNEFSQILQAQSVNAVQPVATNNAQQSSASLLSSLNKVNDSGLHVKLFDQD